MASIKYCESVLAVLREQPRGRQWFTEQALLGELAKRGKPEPWRLALALRWLLFRKKIVARKRQSFVTADRVPVVEYALAEALVRTKRRSRGRRYFGLARGGYVAQGA